MQVNTTKELTFADVLEMLKKPEVKAVTLKNKDFTPFLKYISKKKYNHKLYINYNVRPGFTELKK